VSETETEELQRLRELVKQAHRRGEPVAFSNRDGETVRLCAWCGADRLRAQHNAWCAWPSLEAEWRRLDVAERPHSKDEDCDVDIDTGLCRSCGVDHSGACASCDGRGFHRAGCPEADPEGDGHEHDDSGPNGGCSQGCDYNEDEGVS
jgi:hypothetical protein